MMTLGVNMIEIGLDLKTHVRNLGKEILKGNKKVGLINQKNIKINKALREKEGILIEDSILCGTIEVIREDQDQERKIYITLEMSSLRLI